MPDERVTVTTAATKLPVSLTEAKLHLRLTDSTEDALLTGLIQAAGKTFSALTGRSLQQTEYLAAFSGWSLDSFLALPFATPLISVDSIKYFDTDREEQTLSCYSEETDLIPGGVLLDWGEGWPVLDSSQPFPVRIKYTAGLPSSPEVELEYTVKQWLLLAIGEWYANREAQAIAVGGVFSSLSPGLETLASIYKVDYRF